MAASTKSAHKNIKKCLAMPAGIVTRGVILRALEGHMRKFKTRRRRFRFVAVCFSRRIDADGCFHPERQSGRNRLF